MSDYDFDVDAQIKKHRKSENLFGFRRDPITGSTVGFKRLDNADTSEVMAFTPLSRNLKKKKRFMNEPKNNSSKGLKKIHISRAQPRSSKITRANMGWTTNEKNKLRYLFSSGKGIKKIAIELGRPEVSIILQLKTMGVYDSRAINVNKSNFKANNRKKNYKIKANKKISRNPTFKSNTIDEYFKVVDKIKELQKWKDELQEKILNQAGTIPRIHLHGNKYSLTVSTYKRINVPTLKDRVQFDKLKELLIKNGVYEQVTSPNETLLRKMLMSDKIGNFLKARIKSVCKMKETKVIRKCGNHPKL